MTKLGPHKVPSIGGDNASVIKAAAEKVISKPEYSSILMILCKTFEP